MPSYRLSSRARTDLSAIARYTQSQWGEAQAKKYIRGLQDLFELLAHQPRIGRQIEGKAESLRRLEYQSHVVFYRVTKDGVTVRTIVHKRMLAH